MDTFPAPRMRIVVAIFAAVGLVSAIAGAVSSAGVSRGGGAGFAGQLLHSEGIWLLFAALSPLVLWTARRYPLTTRRLRQSMPAHLLTFFAMSVAHTFVYTTTTELLTTGNLAEVGDVIRATWLRNMRADVFVYAILVGGYYLYAYARYTYATAPASPQPFTPERLVVKARGRITFVELNDIEAIEADGDYVRVRASGRSHLVRETLRAMEESLDAQRFLRIHRSTIVNVSRISELQPHQHGEFFAVMTSGAKLKVSRNYRSAITAAMKIRG